jgi:hypothetical protein
MKQVAFFSLAIFSGLFAAHSFGQTNWVLTGAPSNTWGCVTASADGRILASGVRGSGGIFVSTNRGTSWSQTGASNGDWISMASSADGTVLIAATASPGSIFTSTNGGAAWASNSLPTPGISWSAVAASGDGKKLVAVANAFVFTSTNSGASWRSNDLPSQTWCSIASSADGTKLTLVGNQLWRSVDAGFNWMRITNGPAIGGTTIPSRVISSSSDGTKLFWAPQPTSASGIYVSTDSGDTWTLTGAPALAWSRVVSSADGTTVLAARTFNSVPYVSTNSGATWATGNVSNFVSGIPTTSADGGELLLPANGGFISMCRWIPSPRMNARTVATNVVVSWPVPSTNFVMQQNLNLRTTNWTTLTNVPILNVTHLQDEVTLPVNADVGFYRLRTP